MNRSAPHFGMTGLATMGANLARNMAHHAIPVAVHNRTTAKTERFMTEHGTEGPLSGHASIEEWVGALEHPRVAMIMVSAGAAVDAVIDKVAPHLDDGDVVVDGGNSLFVTPSGAPRSSRTGAARFMSSASPAPSRGRSMDRTSCRQPPGRLRRPDRGGPGTVAAKSTPRRAERARRRRRRPLREDGLQQH